MEGKMNASEFNKAEILSQRKHNTHRLSVCVCRGGIFFRFIIWIINTDVSGRRSEKISLPFCGAEIKYHAAQKGMSGMIL